MHSAIWTARTAVPGAGTNVALSSLTHESSQNFRWISSPSESDSDESLSKGFHSFENPVDMKCSGRINSAAVDLYGETGLHEASIPATSSPAAR